MAIDWKRVGVDLLGIRVGLESIIVESIKD